MLSRGWIRVVAVDALLILASLVFWTWPKALPIPNLDITSMVITLVALCLTIIGFAVYCLNGIADQNADYAIVSDPGKDVRDPGKDVREWIERSRQDGEARGRPGQQSI
jgi:hypothetical protein